ncbi:MAG: flagellar motor switch protein FliN [Planctomycetaceae bacterium]|nr:flagellar motor switch protein FliN [Planctomycetaceae bacterium]
MADRQIWLVEQFARKLAEVAESMVGSAVSAAINASAAIPEELKQETPGALVWQQGFDAGDGCRMVVAAPRASWERIGGEALKAAGVDELDADSVRGTYIEILNQALAGVVSEISGMLDRNVSAVDGKEIPFGAVTKVVEVVINGESVAIYTGIEAPLLALLASGATPPVRPPASANQASHQALSERHELLDGSKTLDLLLDVELPVSVSFGRASVPLKDVLKLTSGSIVELNRGVSDPVELIVNNCVIARGEVVVVEGNYGVRIQQIVSARERLRTLN